jgi:hypothetical protein
MPRASTLRSYLAEFVVAFVGVALAFAVDNFREASNPLTARTQVRAGYGCVMPAYSCRSWVRDTMRLVPRRAVAAVCRPESP